MTTTAFVDTAEPGTLCVRTLATPREVLDGMQLRIKQDGPKMRFTVDRCEKAQVEWQKDQETMELLDGIVVRGLTARKFIAGRETRDEDSDR